MGLRELAESDLAELLEDADGGFGWPITVTNPDGDTDDFVGFSSDISALIDPDTGQLVSGQQASVTLRISSLDEAGLDIPRNIADSDSKPWLVTFLDLGGNEFTFKVRQSMPDYTLGIVVCILEGYVPA